MFEKKRKSTKPHFKEIRNVRQYEYGDDNNKHNGVNHTNGRMDIRTTIEKVKLKSKSSNKKGHDDTNSRTTVDSNPSNGDVYKMSMTLPKTAMTTTTTTTKPQNKKATFAFLPCHLKMLKALYAYNDKNDGDNSGNNGTNITIWKTIQSFLDDRKQLTTDNRRSIRWRGILEEAESITGVHVMDQGSGEMAKHYSNNMHGKNLKKDRTKLI